MAATPVFLRPGGTLGLALRCGLTVALMVGAALHALAHPADAQARIAAELARGRTGQAVALGEAAVARAPQVAALRAELGQAYLRAGRFESAVSGLSDAAALGDSSSRTTLALALAQIACGQNRSALATLDRGAADIAPDELGLALALAGDTTRGIAVLTDSVRDGSATPRLRQNLAYAYALDGRWADARLTAGFDLPPDRVDARLQQWAQSMEFGGERLRIARLLNVPVTDDQGMPETLALSGTDAASTSPPALTANSAGPAAQTDASGELLPAAAAPFAAPVAPAEAAPASAVPNSAGIVQDQPPPAPMPIVDTAPAVARWRAMSSHRALHLRGPAANLGYIVQLGAYSSARRAALAREMLARRNPQSRAHGIRIARARVNGRAYWRLVTSHFDYAAAGGTCARLKRHGGACLATANHAPHRETLALANTRG